MKKLLVLFLIVLGVPCMAQSKYELGMQKAMQEWHAGNSTNAKAVLDRVAVLDKENWIPVYYKVFIDITDGFKNPDKVEIEGIIENNRLIIEKWLDIGGDEWYILKGMNETLELLTDPMNKGMQQTPIISKAYEKAISLNPNNPRALYSLASFYINSAKFTKVDTTYYCEMLNKSIELFDQQSNDLSFFPSWGKEWAVNIKSKCAVKE
ncbi:tetratricopeptide repeat protein [Myroides injenensis]|uniref:tetratricopeptide repeat protein n=1 Tax=Myroides injenensis TaxID=1183151 RepID=UPI000288837B|nr:tetratricopeptide repeat protein [Myroides injenensis]